MATLADDGFRFIFRNGIYAWTHPAEVRPSDQDCTDMDDAEFEQFVKERPCRSF